VDLSHTRDQANQKTGVPPPQRLDLPRGRFRAYDGKVPQASTITRSSGRWASTGDAGLSAPYLHHRTRSIDYAIVLDGEIDMLLDDQQCT